MTSFLHKVSSVAVSPYSPAHPAIVLARVSALVMVLESTLDMRRSLIISSSWIICCESTGEWDSSKKKFRGLSTKLRKERVRLSNGRVIFSPGEGGLE